MRTFEEWLIDEGLMKNLALGGALLGAGFGASKLMNKPVQPDVQQTKQVSQQPHHHNVDKQSNMSQSDKDSPIDWNSANPKMTRALQVVNDVATGKYGPGEEAWSDRLGKYMWYETPEGMILSNRDGYYKRVLVHGRAFFHKFNIDTGTWGPRLGITDHMRRTWQRDN